MKFVETGYFLEQLTRLSHKYPQIYDDYKEFKKLFNPSFETDLGRNIFKARRKNSSIPVGKRWWLRIIVKVYHDKVLPILVYAKTIKSNVNDWDIYKWLEMVLKEL